MVGLWYGLPENYFNETKTKYQLDKTRQRKQLTIYKKGQLYRLIVFRVTFFGDVVGRVGSGVIQKDLYREENRTPPNDNGTRGGVYIVWHKIIGILYIYRVT